MHVATITSSTRFLPRDYYALAGIFRSTQTIVGRKSGIWSDVNRVLLPETPSQLSKRAGALQQYQEDLEEALAIRQEVEAEKSRLTSRQKSRPEGDSDQKEELENEIQEVEKKLREATHQVDLIKFNRPGPPMAITTQDRPVTADAHIRIRGNPHSLGEQVARGFLSLAWDGPPPRLATRRPLDGGYVQSSGRLELAEWLVDDQKNPLTSRVMVNRVWHHLFGVGLVRTVDNFGLQGEGPSHPELLDYLATRFVEQGWSVKKIIQEIVRSRAYRQASSHNPTAQEVDPENRLLWRANRRRLEVEAFRDALLAVSGRLDRTRGGPTLPVNSSDDMIFARPESLSLTARAANDVLLRRTVYLPVARKDPLEGLEMLSLFGFPNPDQIVGARPVTTVPTQNLYLLNSPFLREQAQVTARALLEEKGLDDRKRIRQFFLKALNRPATDEEVDRALEFLSGLEKQVGVLSEAPENARVEAWTRYCHAVLVSNEFLFRG